ncbi:MAG TPA: M28 family peptidase [Vicinamibacterales bacterium]|nr:M28 family peptidase [Vicinamibacterales bacterium]
MRRLILTAICALFAACVSAQTPTPPGSSQTPAFDSARAFEHLTQLVAIGPRPAGSPGAEKTRDYIRQQMKALGIATREQAFDAKTPVGIVKMVNVAATIPGPGTGRLIIAGHYDTKLFKEFRFVGANDAGSSTAFLLELARVLKDRKNALTIELLFLDGEEAIGEWETGNTYGSRHYVLEAATDAASLKRIKAMILVDMIGDKDLVIKRESRSTPWLVDAIWSAARRLNRPEFIDESTPIDDDHLPFLAAGIPAVDLIDLEYPNLSSPTTYWHTAHDTLDKVSPNSLQAVGDVLLAALPAIELRIK